MQGSGRQSAVHRNLYTNQWAASNLQPSIKDSCCGGFLTSHYAKSAVKTAGNGV